MLPERFKTMFRSASSVAPLGFTSGPTRGTARVALDKDTVSVRQSRAMEQFFSYISDRVGLSILDLAGATQENITFVTDLGHKLYTQDFLRSLDDTFGPGGDQTNAALIDYFLEQNLDFADETFDAVLMWDVMQFLSPALLNATVQRLQRIVKPRSYLLGFLHADEKITHAPKTTFRIKSPSTIELTERGTRKLVQSFNNRSLEKVFGQSESVKFFLTRENLREIIVKR